MSDEQAELSVRVRTFATVRMAVGAADLTVSLPAGATVADLLDRLTAEHPALTPHLEYIIVTVNHDFADRSLTLARGDEVALFPPVSGGSENTHVTITADPINVEELLASVIEPGAGAVVTFAGVVREHNLGRKVDYLEYEAYPEMAVAKLRQVVTEARARWPKIRGVAVAHRVGHLELGETAVLIAVGAPHRDDGAFDAARYAIDRIKEIVPLWKKEGWSDGEEWLEGNYRPSPGE